MNHFEKVFQCFPPQVKAQLDNLRRDISCQIEEIRVYKGKEVQIFAGGNRLALKGIIEGSDLNNLLNNLMKYSYYAYEEDLAKGFITIDGGHRVGICGKTVMENGRVTLIRDISSVNIRYAREVPGCSEALMKYIINSDQSLNNLLIVSPPGCGKTTLLRDIAANLSRQGYKTGICDERSEIAGMYNGRPSYDFGTMVDVLDGCPKAEGMIMLIRSMSPQVIFTDEIGKPADLEAIRACESSGVKLITTIHGYDMDDLRKSAVYQAIENKTFGVLVFLTDLPKVGTIREVRCV